ncbi:MAG: thioether cross-link-forming SCIFF peptide maturase [Eubacterium sp.]|nr:thioether cross-link-forming SCIFF peptide maturase [Eubacterium sp.]
MVHQFKNNGYNIVLDVCSGSVHVVDDLVYDIIEVFEGRSKEEVAAKLKEEGKEYKEEDIYSAYDDVQSLVDAEQLFTEDIFQTEILDFKKRKTVVKALCLNVSHDCNLACKYCFAGQGEYHGDRALMSYEVGKQALDFLVANSGSRKNLEVDFFGGEPLMNLDVVKQLVEYGRSIEEEKGKKFRFTLTTNGVLLDDDFVEYANKELKNVVLSIDGRKEVNDRMRPTRNGKGSYDIIMPKFKEFAKKRQGEYYIRGTFTHNNLDFCDDVVNFIEEGFKEISMEPVVAAPEEPYAIREEDVPVIKEQYDKLAKILVDKAKEGKPVNFFHFNIDLAGGPCVYKRLSGCGSGTEYLAVTPWGDLYPCHQFVGQEDFKLGDVWHGIDNEKIVEEFKCNNVYAKDKCKNCFARFYCSGGCAANAYQFHNKILEAYDIGCELEQKRIECALMMKAALSDVPGVAEMSQTSEYKC